MADDFNWDNVDSDVVCERAPERLNAHHLSKLIAKHGDQRGREKYIAAVDAMTRKMRIIPPSGRR